MKRKRWLRCLARCGVAIAAFLLAILQQGTNLLNKQMDTYFLQIFGGPQPAADILLYIIFQNIPWVLFLYVFAPQFQNDFAIQAVYVFTRVGSKQKWLRKKTAGLLGQILLAWVLLFVVVFGAGAVMGLLPGGNAALYVEIFFLQAGGLFVIAFFQNLLSLQIGITQSFVLGICLYFGSIFLAISCYSYTGVAGWLFPMLPTVGQMLLWHADAAVSAQNRELFFAGTAQFTVWKSFVADVVYAIVIYAIAAWHLQRTDLMQYVKEES